MSLALQLHRLAAAVLLLVALATAPAAAHAVLLSTVPADGGMLAAAPDELVLTFNEPVELLSAHLNGPDGGSAVPLASGAASTRLVLKAADLWGEGTRVLSWRVASGDGHPVAGTVLYSVGRASVVAPAGEDPSDPVARAGLWAARLVVHAGLFFGVGATFWAAAAGRRSRTAVVLPLAGLAALPLAFGLHGVDALGGGVALLASGHPWLAAAGTSFAAFAAIAAVALTHAVAAGRIGGRAAIVLAVAAVVASGLALAATGHAAAAEPRLVTRTALVVHGAALALWLGALPPLWTALRAPGPGGAHLLARFSALAPVAVAGLAVGGLALAAVQLTGPADLVATGYGRVLAVKLVLVAVLLAIAVVNRRRHTAPALAGDPAALRRLRRNVAAEIAIGLAVLAVVGLFRFTPPPRALAAAEAAPVAFHVHTLPVMADVEIAPGRAGPVRFEATLMTGDFGPLDPREVRIEATNAGAGIGPIRAALVRRDGRFVADGLLLPAPGRWALRLVVLIDDFHQESLDASFDLAP
ncbi:CopD family protein [Oharaeibacter diazotrophicus]|uniref:Copper transport protein n=2 Tax=Oharaeibacter diazotrophicus TaxID=1920512 RepID=A0A4R6R9A6_9HYPH|nr:CopD family protein [Oharaeibacter diazotrophicus]TDP82641.1 copper transport protein [Oharaeibacter diazotrophicus]BBE72595.1 copper transport protein YcnJ precursor [Pleomorphomonas sp. SM30]GLS76628.1 copper resistance protein C [Oharaeibacter diazotrophicus]